MMMHAGHGGLPDPTTEARFYEGVAPRRLISFLLDTVATLALGALAGLAIGVVTLGLGLFVMLPVMATTAFLYRVASLARWSATPGMLVTGIELRRPDGQRLGAADAVWHTALFFGLAMSGVLQVASVAMMLLTPHGRGIHDAILGTAAIHRSF